MRTVWMSLNSIFILISAFAAIAHAEVPADQDTICEKLTSGGKLCATLNGNECATLSNGVRLCLGDAVMVNDAKFGFLVGMLFDLHSLSAKNTVGVNVTDAEKSVRGDQLGDSHFPVSEVTKPNQAFGNTGFNYCKVPFQWVSWTSTHKFFEEADGAKARARCLAEGFDFCDQVTIFHRFTFGGGRTAINTTHNLAEDCVFFNNCDGQGSQARFHDVERVLGYKWDPKAVASAKAQNPNVCEVLKQCGQSGLSWVQSARNVLLCGNDTKRQTSETLKSSLSVLARKNTQ